MLSFSAQWVDRSGPARRSPGRQLEARVALLASIFRLVLVLANAALLLAVPLAGTASAQVAAGPRDPRHLAFFPPVQTSGQVRIGLHPAPEAVGRPVVVGFGMPFPPGFVSDPERISLVDNIGKELPIRVAVLGRWPQGMPGAGSLRAVLIQFEDYLGADLERHYLVRWGERRSLSERRTWPARQGWLPVRDGSYPEGAVSEPPVYVTLPPEWLGQCLLKGRVNPGGTNPGFAWYDQAMNAYFSTAINQFPHPVEDKHLISYQRGNEPWLYDRAMALFVVYIRQGGLEPLRQAHRAAQYYASLVGPDGRFGLLDERRGPDMKYGYQECLATDYWLTGDESLKEASRRVAALLGGSWKPDYNPERGFWNERGLAFALLNATVAYELLDEPVWLDQARAQFQAAHSLQFNPPPGAPAGTGCLVHRGKQHGEKGENLEGWYCSPWMGALLADAMLRYYLVSGDSRTPESILGLGRFVARMGIYSVETPQSKRPYLVPSYIASAEDPARSLNERTTDQQHALDVARSLALALYFCPPGDPVRPELEKALDELLDTARYDFERNHNKLGAKFAKPSHPLNPPRRFSWWFRTTADLDWLLQPR